MATFTCDTVSVPILTIICSPIFLVSQKGTVTKRMDSEVLPSSVFIYMIRLRGSFLISIIFEVIVKEFSINFFSFM